jgi:hypothetical protein
MMMSQSLGPVFQYFFTAGIGIGLGLAAAAAPFLYFKKRMTEGFKWQSKQQKR